MLYYSLPTCVCPGSSTAAAQAMRDLIRSRHGGGADGGSASDTRPKSERPPQRTLRALSGALHVDSSLRYKVKMWMFRAAPAAAAGAAAATPTAIGQAEPVPDGALVPGSCTAAASNAAAKEGEGDGEPHAAYCMLTVIIRNGLAALMRGRSEYLDFARRAAANAGLHKDQVYHVAEFADAWQAWATKHAPDVVNAGGRAASRYLDAAERFVAAFTAGVACSGGGAFHGVLLMVGFEEDVVEGVAARLGASYDPGARPNLTRAAAVRGSVISMVPWTGSVRTGSVRTCAPCTSTSCLATVQFQVSLHPPPLKSSCAGSDSRAPRLRRVCAAVDFTS